MRQSLRFSWRFGVIACSSTLLPVLACSALDERKIRFSRNVSQIFEHFASIRSTTSEEEPFMSLDDFAIAITPGSSSKMLTETQKRSLVKYMSRKRGLKWIDCSGDGKISFREYVFVLTLLSIPPSDFGLVFSMFDTSQDGHLDRSEFNEMLSVVQRKSEVGKIAFAEESESRDAILDLLFGGWWQRTLSLKGFMQFLSEFHEEVISLQFLMYDYDQTGFISIESFLELILSHSDGFDKIIERIRRSKYSNLNVSLKDWKRFNALLQETKKAELALELFSNGSEWVTAADLHRAASNAVHVDIPIELIEAIFVALGCDVEGRLKRVPLFLDLRVAFDRFSVHGLGSKGLGRLPSCLSNCIFS